MITKKPKAKMYGNRIKEILEKKGMSPQELSDLTKIIPSHISRIINGQRRCISLPTAIKIAQVLKKPVEYVFIYDAPIITEQKPETPDGN
jgi:transcriptional regulator with XRE-family HTH domain